MDLRDTIALVTGGAHRVGRGIALELARRGAGVVLHYGTSEEEARRTEEDVTDLGVPCWRVQADLRDPEAIETMFEQLDEELPRLDLLVNSAASFRSRAFREISAEEWDEVLAVNLRAPFLLTQRAAERMNRSSRPAGESGLVVNLSDLSGLQAWKGYAHHGVSKAGLLHLTRLSAVDLAPTVRVNAIVPGAILPPPGRDETSEEWRRSRRRIPLERSGSPELVGRTVAYLADNEFLTGAVVRLDGGEALVAARDMQRAVQEDLVG